MFAQELELVHDSVEDNGSYSTVMDAIDSEWFEQSLLASNIPNRRLPAQQAAWLVLWTGLIRNHSIKEACGSMGIALQPGDNAWSRVAPSVLKDCRRRLVEVPMSYLFKSTVSAWLEQALGESNDLGLTTLAVDGTVFRCQDSEENAQDTSLIFSFD